MSKHRPDTSEESARFTRTCVCGGQIVYFEPPLVDEDDSTWRFGYGCEKFGRPSRPFDACGRQGPA